MFIGLLAALAAVFHGTIAGWVDTVKDRFSDPQPIHADAVRASSEDPAHPAALAVDGTSDRYWSPAVPGCGQGQYLEGDFANAFRLTDIVVHPGVSTVPEQFLAQARPRVLQFTVTTSDGRTVNRSFTLTDKPGEQKFHLALGDVVRIRATVGACYGETADRRVAIAEVEFFKRP
ncbi:discoidin domain-containing protein [Yinghuangia seranimata]|uniref:discoidin domain-containing protein n=1 Tax=Yinghuangia seranimata TaxID=408067 RepID=UPI00248CD1E6|nr:discoidin domain-containing protein [Yinghuangia seranimata]MDI2125266.1 discoidin domain-containing protein [Yinghuangia seranimata]